MFAGVVFQDTQDDLGMPLICGPSQMCLSPENPSEQEAQQEGINQTAMVMSHSSILSHAGFGL